MPVYPFFMHYKALDVIFTITFHLDAFGKTWGGRRQKSQEVRHPAFGRLGLHWKPPTFTFIPMGGRISVPRTQPDSNPRQRAGLCQPGCGPTVVALFT